MIYYTSDLHLGHANVIRHCNRPFADVTQMDKTLVENWNRIVHRNDTVYIVGDFIFRAKCTPDEYLSVLTILSINWASAVAPSRGRE